MKKILIAISMLAMAACQNAEKPQEERKIISQPSVIIENGVMSPEVLWAFGRIGNLCVSPDQSRIAYTVTYYDISENRGNSEIYVMDSNGKNKKQLTYTAEREGALAWHPSGKSICFLRNGKLMEIDPDSAKESQISDIQEHIDDYLLSPSGKKALFVITTKLEKYTGAEVYTDLPEAEAYIYDDLMYRHWDSWKDGTYSHIYIGDVNASAKVTSVTDIMPGEPYDAPLKPFGGIDQITWSPDENTIVYTCKKFTGKEYALQTNSNLYSYNLASKKTTLLTPNMPGYDERPMFSPDGSKLLWLSMERGGYEADKERIMIMDIKNGEIKNYSKTFDASPSSIQWSENGKTLYFTAPYQESYQIHKLDIATETFTRLTEGNHDYQSIAIAKDALIATHTTSVHPAEIYRIDPSTGKGENISFVNKELMDKLNVPTLEKRFTTTTDNKQMVTWVVYPPNFDATKKYPILLMCTGGPQGALSPSFSYRWSYMLMASQGYVVVVPARRGTSGSGQEWCDAISKNHGQQEEKDLLSAIDNISKEPWADKERIGAMGASFGGYSIFHLAGTHNGRFKCFLAHCGIFNMEFMYSSTEELFFENWECGGAPWEKENKVAQRSFSHSAHHLVNKWNTPLMVVHGEKDFRVPFSQGMAAFNTAQMLGVESKLLLFPTENHWVLKPQNALVWQREFFKWFDSYLK